MPVGVELERRAPASSPPARRAPCGSRASAAETSRAAASGSPHGASAGPRAGEHLVHVAVGQPLVRADHRALELHPPDLGAGDVHLHRHRQLVLARAQRAGAGWRAPRAASARPRRARRRWCRGGRPRRRSRRRGARRRTRRRCAPTAARSRRARSAEIASSKSLASSGSMVNVASSRRSARAASTSTSGSAASASTLRGNERRRPRSSISASITSRATSGLPIFLTTRGRACRCPRARCRPPSRRGRPASRACRCARTADAATRKRPRLRSTPIIEEGQRAFSAGSSARSAGPRRGRYPDCRRRAPSGARPSCRCSRRWGGSTRPR